MQFAGFSAQAVASQSARMSAATASGFALGERGLQTQNLLGPVPPECRLGDDDDTFGPLDSEGVPRLAGTEPIDVAGAQRFSHEGWRQHHQPHVPVRVDAAGGKPVAKLVVVA